MNLTGKQIIAIAVAVLGVLITSTAQLTDLFGSRLAHNIVSIAGLTNSILASVLAALTSQSQMLTQVQDMPGVERITVNKDANSTLAALAVDPANAKIAPAPGAESAVMDTARNA